MAWIETDYEPNGFEPSISYQDLIDARSDEYVLLQQLGIPVLMEPKHRRWILGWPDATVTVTLVQRSLQYPFDPPCIRWTDQSNPTDPSHAPVFTALQFCSAAASLFETWSPTAWNTRPIYTLVGRLLANASLPSEASVQTLPELLAGPTRLPFWQLFCKAARLFPGVLLSLGCTYNPQHPSASPDELPYFYQQFPAWLLTTEQGRRVGLVVLADRSGDFDLLPGITDETGSTSEDWVSVRPTNSLSRLFQHKATGTYMWAFTGPLSFDATRDCCFLREAGKQTHLYVAEYFSEVQRQGTLDRRKSGDAAKPANELGPGWAGFWIANLPNKLARLVAGRSGPSLFLGRFDRPATQTELDVLVARQAQLRLRKKQQQQQTQQVHTPQANLTLGQVLALFPSDLLVRRIAFGRQRIFDQKDKETDQTRDAQGQVQLSQPLHALVLELRGYGFPSPLSRARLTATCVQAQDETKRVTLDLFYTYHT